MKRILIVEDEIELGTVLSELLSDYDYETVLTYSGNEALAKIGEFGLDHFEMIISDVKMDDGDGIQLYTEICKMPGRNPEFIFFTAYGEALPRDIHGDEAVKVLTKPLDIDLLIKLLI